MTIASALAGLLEAVDNDRRARCSALLAEADAKAGAMQATARAEARRRLRAALRAERQRAGERIAAAQADLQTAQRRSRQARAALAVTTATALLPDALQAIWSDPIRRRQWLDAALRRAAAALPRRDWRCRHPLALADDDVEWLGVRADELGVVGVHCEADAGIVAGVAIECGGARLDASTDGLLADRALIEGRLLHFLETA